MSLLGELTIRSVGRTLEKEITRIENVRHANKNIDSVTLYKIVCRCKIFLHCKYCLTLDSSIQRTDLDRKVKKERFKDRRFQQAYSHPLRFLVLKR